MILPPVPFSLRTTTLCLALACGPGLGMASTSPATPAAPAQTARHYTIPAGPLEAVLARFAAESGVLLAADPGLLAGRVSAGLQGRWTADEGLQRVLAGTGVQASADARGQYVLQAVAPATAMLTPVLVRAPAPSASTESAGGYTAALVTLGKREQALRDIPQAVTVITRQRLDDQDLRDVQEVLRNAPGVSVVANDPGGQAYSRGFFIESFQFDGVPLERQLYARGSAFNSDSALFDRVEILRGAQGLFEGAGAPAGSINLVRKRPTRERQMVLTARAGSWDRVGLQADLAGPLNASGSVRGRALVHGERMNSFREHLDSRERTGYLAVDADLGPDTVLGVGVSRERPRRTLDWGGLPNHDDGSMPDYPRSANLSAPWNHASKTQDTWYADLTQRLSGDWQAKASVVYVREANDIRYLLRSGRLGPPNTVRANVYDFDMRNRNLGADVHASGSLPVWHRPLTLTVGANLSRFRSTDIWGWLSNVESLAERYDQRPSIGDPGRETILAGNRMDDGYRSSKHGVYGVAHYPLTDRLSTTLGTRVSWHEQTYRSNGAWGLSESTAKASREFTPFAGLVFELNRHGSLYANYASIFNPQTQRSRDGSFLAPIDGSTVEIGAKGEWHDARLTASFALFRTKQSNIGFEDVDVDEDTAGRWCGGTCYRPSAHVRSEGVEAELAGEVSRGWELSAAYTFTRTRYQGEDVPDVGYNISANTGIPRHMLKLWSTYRLPGDWQRLTVGGGVRSQSASSGFGYYGRRQGGYTLLDARLAYQLSPRATVALNVQNVTDKHYFSSTSYNNNQYGEPRSFLVTLQYRH